MRQEADTGRQAEDPNRPVPSDSDFDPVGLLDRLPGMAFRCSWDGEWTMVFVSQGALDLTGYDAAELLARKIRWSQLIHDEDLVDVVKGYRRAARDGRTFRIRYRIRTSGSRVRWVRETGTPVSGGFPLEFEGYIVAEETAPTADTAIEASGDAPRALNQAFDIFVAVDANGAVTAWNRQAERKSGWPRSEALGQDLVELAVEPEYRDAVRARLREIAENHVAEEFSRHWNLRALRRDGTSFPVEVNMWASDEDDRLQVNAFVRDLTPLAELKGKVADLEDRLERLSRIDELTGLASRSVLDTELARSVAFAHRWRQPLSIVVVSPRPRSAANPESGAGLIHEALVTISDIVRSSCRTEDVAARFDDNAILLLFQTTGNGAGIVADRLWRKIGASESADRVNLYVGMATLHRGEDAATLVERAFADLRPDEPRTRQIPQDDESDPTN